MTNATTTFQFFWRDPSVGKNFRSGVSLHSHTMHSEESLEMVPRYAAHIPFVGRAMERLQAEYRRRTGQPFEFERAFWTPPLTPRQAYRLEEKQIQSRFQLPALVSLTDHDNMQAGALLQVLGRFRHAPISTEWTVPFGPTFFHVGIHNIPAAERNFIAEQLAAFTANPAPDKLTGIFEMLNASPDVLLILNHPLWDEKGIGTAEHAQTLGRFLERHGRSLHALELNGLRCWKENKQIIWLGSQTGLPVVSGGDRHGLEPNAILNLSNADNLVDFIHEVRYRRYSHVVFMPQYHEPLKLRYLQTMSHIMRDYPSNVEGRRTWADRVFFRSPDQVQPIPLKAMWQENSPALIRHFVAVMKLLEWRGIRSALRLALDDRASVWRTHEMDMEAPI